MKPPLRKSIDIFQQTKKKKKKSNKNQNQKPHTQETKKRSLCYSEVKGMNIGEVHLAQAS